MIIIWFVLLLLFQILHIFEEIGFEAYKVSKSLSLNRYLILASSIMVFNMITLLGIIFDSFIGYLLGTFTSIMAVGNGVVHTIGLLSVRRIKGSIGSGVFTAVPLGIIGVICLIQIIQKLFLY